MTTEPKDNPTNEPEGGVPEWGKQLQQAVQELTEKLTSQPAPANQQEVPVPPEPKHEELEVELEQEQELEVEQPKQSKAKNFLKWLM